MAIKELEINGQFIPLVQNVSELTNDANYTTKQEVEKTVDALTASDISYDKGTELNENITNVETALTFSLTKERTINVNPGNNIIILSTKITNVILDNDYDYDNNPISFNYSGQKECTIVIYNKTGDSVIIPTNYKIGNYTTIPVNNVSSVTLLNNSSCEINIIFTNGEARILILI